MRFLLVTFFVLTISAFFITLYGVLYAAPVEPATLMPAPGNRVAVARTLPEAQPEKLVIPVIGVDAEIKPVGLTKSGNMGSLESYAQVAWYKYGPGPGAPGNAVMAGHLDNAISLPGVFKKLHQLEYGDDIYVAQASGKRLHYKVTDIKVLSYDTADTEQIFATEGESQLVLITCEGTWDQTLRKYTDRLAVFATLVR